MSLFSQEDAKKTSLTRWNTKAKVDTSLLFDFDQEARSDSADYDDNGSSALETDAPSSRDHVLSVEDQFLLLVMKLRLGFTNLDLAIRFNVPERTISNTFTSWLRAIGGENKADLTDRGRPIPSVFWPCNTFQQQC